jgi:hypothetical protein
MEVGAQAVALRVYIRESPALQQPVIGKLDSRNEVSRSYGCLLHLSEEVLRISILNSAIPINQRREIIINSQNAPLLGFG